MFELDNAKDNFTITDYNTANILNTHTHNVEGKSNARVKRKRKAKKGEEKKLHQKHQFL